MIAVLERLLFGHRRKILVVFALMTLILGSFAMRVHPDASFDKLLPSNNAYIDTYKRTQQQFWRR